MENCKWLHFSWRQGWELSSNTGNIWWNCPEFPFESIDRYQVSQLRCLGMPWLCTNSCSRKAPTGPRSHFHIPDGESSCPRKNEDVRQRRKHAKKLVLSNFISLHFQNFEGCLVILIKCFIVRGHGHFLSFYVNIDFFSHFQKYISSQHFQWSNSVSRTCLYWHINTS